jgi:hypothetical protein
MVDSQTGLNVPKFAACSACVRNLEILMPPLQSTFRRQPGLQEKFCDLAVESPRFVQYVDILDAAATQCEYERYKYPDNGRFIDYLNESAIFVTADANDLFLEHGIIFQNCLSLPSVKTATMMSYAPWQQQRSQLPGD